MHAANYLSATTTQRQLRDGVTTIPQILTDHKARFDKRDRDVHAWVVARHLELIHEAEIALEGTLHNGNAGPRKLTGITVGVKDNMSGHQRYANEIFYRDSEQPGSDASVVAMCRAEGALILGKTVTTEFACGIDLPSTNNPLDLSRTTGYSSAGSAAAVADYQCHVAFGTQTIASVIEPASFNGIFGYKPTWGYIDTHGVKITSPSLDTIGMFARWVSDLQLLSTVFGVTSPPIDLNPRDIGACRFAFVKTDQFAEYASDDLKAVWLLAKQILRDARAEVVDVELDDDYKNMGNSYEICDEQVAISLSAKYQIEPENLSSALQEMVETGGGLSHEAAQTYRDHIAILRPQFDKLARDFDAIIAPSCAGEAPRKDEFDPATRFCGLWTALQAPVVGVPGFAGSSGLPISLSLVGPRHGDAELLRVADLVARVFAEKGNNDKLRKVPIF